MKNFIKEEFNAIQIFKIIIMTSIGIYAIMRIEEVIRLLRLLVFKTF